MQENNGAKQAQQIYRRLKDRWEGHTPQLLGGRSYAVLCPLILRQGEWEVLFEVRSAALSQGGQVCFPGGRMEPGESAVVCALRETWEEVSIPSREVEVLGRGDFLFHQRGFVLYPVIAAVSRRGFMGLRPSSQEVQAVFTVPLSFFRDVPPKRYAYDLLPRLAEDFPREALGLEEDYPFGRGRVETPVWRYQGRIIWGLTARVTEMLVSSLRLWEMPF